MLISPIPVEHFGQDNQTSLIQRLGHILLARMADLVRHAWLSRCTLVTKRLKCLRLGRGELSVFLPAQPAYGFASDVFPCPCASVPGCVLSARGAQKKWTSMSFGCCSDQYAEWCLTPVSSVAAAAPLVVLHPAMLVAFGGVRLGPHGTSAGLELLQNAEANAVDMSRDG